MINVKSIFLLFICTFSVVLVSSQEIKLTDIMSAEERINYNKRNHIDKYEGVLIEYVYTVAPTETTTKEQYFEASKKHFDDLIDVSIYEVNDIVFLSVLTKGSVMNHKNAIELERFFKFKIFIKTRKYHLI
jgi:hypothetical protein